MTRRIIFLNSGREAPFFRDFARDLNPAVETTNVEDLAGLQNAVDACDGHARLIAFATNVIVPVQILSRLALTPYNIHPAPPEYPGSHPEAWAIWEGSAAYGATAHEITKSVDAGAIVAVLRYPTPPNSTRRSLSDFSYAEALKVFAVVAAHCAQSDAAMPVAAARWCGTKRTRRDFEALCRCDNHPAGSLTAADRTRLRAACGPAFVDLSDGEADQSFARRAKIG